MNLDDLKDVEEFDEIIQLQIDEFCQSIARATSAKTVVVIVDSGEALQTAMHTSGGKGPAVAQMEAIRTLCVVAGGALSGATKGAFSLLVREPDGTLSPAMPEETKAIMGRRQ